MGLSLVLSLNGCKSPKKSAERPPKPVNGFHSENLAEASNHFALDLFRQVHTKSDNLVFSPYSIGTVLAMIYSGAEGETAEEIREVLYFPPANKLDPAVKELKDRILSGDTLPGTEINLANAIWAQAGFNFLPEYIENIQHWYDAPLTEMDFINEDSREKNRIRINSWVEDNTKQKIRELLSPGVLDANTRMVLTNAIYFKGEWMWEFDKARTAASIFRVSSGQTVMTDFMHLTQTLPYYEDDEVQSIKLPYRHERLSMIIILPKSVEGWEMISRVLDLDRLRKMESQFESTEVQLSIPKFSLELKLNLREELSAMGMGLAFSRDADLSGMNGEKNLFVSEVIHKAFIEVSERGTEASAATGAVISLKSSLKESPLRFHADHPFLYLIQDRQTGCIIFLGRLVKPS